MNFSKLRSFFCSPTTKAPEKELTPAEQQAKDIETGKRIAVLLLDKLGKEKLRLLMTALHQQYRDYQKESPIDEIIIQEDNWIYLKMITLVKNPHLLESEIFKHERLELEARCDILSKVTSLTIIREKSKSETLSDRLFHDKQNPTPPTYTVTVEYANKEKFTHQHQTFADILDNHEDNISKEQLDSLTDDNRKYKSLIKSTPSIDAAVSTDKQEFVMRQM